ncbi:hypothetical protein BZG36_04808 [Bifiguratus adelaidae]|uniref:Major facilitator superfamily (MFS) profile domain-containing protein n=1 Tax=Bifiguratus adelaidae TaxID=1938954 RepID=A0A261XUZ4_9FUNG|nr:hypothetical protein BZG36_04808 [Bifiguratus adelaidae]
MDEPETKASSPTEIVIDVASVGMLKERTDGSICEAGDSRPEHAEASDIEKNQEKEKTSWLSRLRKHAPVEVDQDGSVIMSTRQLVTVFIGKALRNSDDIYRLSLALFLAALDGTIVATALPTIGSDFQAYQAASWVANGYILTFDTFQPLFSKISDIFGRKHTLLFTIAVFEIGSILCGASTSIIMLIVSRVIAGVGGAGVFSMVFITISDIVPLQKRGKFQGIISAVFALSSVFGPLIGGSFTDHVSWRWNFYINIPFGVAATFMIFIYLHLPKPTGSLMDKIKRVDYSGTCLVLVFGTLLLLGLNFGGETFPWKSAGVIAPLVIAVVALACLVYYESRRAVEPIIPPQLFRLRTCVATFICNWFFGMTFFSLVYYLPTYFQVVRGDDATTSGLRMIPMQIAIAIGSTLSGLTISKWGRFKPLVIAGTCLMTIGTGLTTMFDVNTSFGEVYGFGIILGFGVGSLFASTVIAVQSAAERKDMATATGLCNFFRIMGGAVGVAASATLLNNSLQQTLQSFLPPDLVDATIRSTTFVHQGLPQQYFGQVINAYMIALRDIYYMNLGCAGVAFIASCCLKHSSVKKRKAPKQTEREDPNQSAEQPADLEKATNV